jgi:hypothetical protein|nr:MAG TPA: Head Tail Connector Protein [Caudoviricetes sp.]
MSLLEELKNYLDITWEDEGTDKKLGGILNRAQNILSEYAGEALSFDSDQETEKQLLFDCCRYIYNNSLEDFKVNFGAELITLRAKFSVKAVSEDAEVPKV